MCKGSTKFINNRAREQLFLKKSRKRLFFRYLFLTFATMKASEQTLQQTERAIRKVAEKFPSTEEATQLTDIHVRVLQETGEILIFDDDDNEINRCVVEQWIDNKDDSFYQDVAAVLRRVLTKMKDTIEKMSILKPFSFVLENDDKETIEELYLVDDDIVILDKELMADLDKDLDNFLEKLLKD